MNSYGILERSRTVLIFWISSERLSPSLYAGSVTETRFFSTGWSIIRMKNDQVKLAFPILEKVRVRVRIACNPHPGLIPFREKESLIISFGLKPGRVFEGLYRWDRF